MSPASGAAAVPQTGPSPIPARREAAPEVDISKMILVRPRRWGRMTAVVAILLILAWLIKAFAEGTIAWDVTGEYMFWPTVLAGVWGTIWMSIACMTMGIVIGVVCAVMRGSPNPVLRWVAIGYQWFFRGTPVVLQLLIWFNLALVFPYMGIPGIGSARTVDLITPIVATLLGLGLNQGAYTSEVVRAGLLSVDRGQYEAAQAIGMGYWTSLRRIVLPQAMRVVIPPLGNEFIGLVKMTSLASIIGFSDLLRSVQDIYYLNARVIELLMVAAAWYLVVVTLLSIGQSVLERRFGRGFASGVRTE